MSDELKCPVCGDAFGNEGALATHEALTKDAPHLAHRSGAPPAPAAPASPALGEAKAGEASAITPPPASSKPESQANSEAIVIQFPSPPEVRPLLGEGEGMTASPPPAASAPVKVDVPLEPFLAGGIAAVVNGFVLRGEGDGEVSALEVSGTGFPKAAEACLKQYFPTVAWDHPLVALFMSGAGLAALVAGKKAKKKPDEEAKAPAQASEASEAPPAPPEKADGTGDAYWDAIIQQAGGAPNGE